MGTVQLRSNINRLVKSTKSEQLLLAVQELLSGGAGHEGKLWASLTDEQQREVLLAFEESEDETRLIDSEKVFGRF